MTIGGVSLTNRLLWFATAAAGFVALVIVVLNTGGGTRAAAAASLTCNTDTITYGDTVTCTVTTTDSVTLAWGDGATTTGAGTFAHPIDSVGPTTVAVVAAGGELLATHVVDIGPDIHIDCDQGLPLPIYELAPSQPEASQPYDYVYLSDDGSTIRPGQPGYPTNLGEMLAMERSVLGEAPIVGLCRAVSAAVDTHGGSVTWTVESPWYDAYVTKSRNITPGTPAHWDGVQPIDVSIVVDVDGFEASERIGVYFGGCG